MQEDKRQQAISLSDKDQKELLNLARRTIKYYLDNNEQPEAGQIDVAVTEAMQQKRAAFVTLKRDGQLRGCIGEILPRSSLYESVIRNAINAAVNDWRFTPVIRTECDKLSIEISALTVPRTVGSYNDVRIGIDGVILSKAGKSAVFLPQVAPEQGWGIEETLTHLSLKAGLSADAWKEGAQLEVFQAEVFGEDD